MENQPFRPRGAVESMTKEESKVLWIPHISLVLACRRKQSSEPQSSGLVSSKSGTFHKSIDNSFPNLDRALALVAHISF